MAASEHGSTLQLSTSEAAQLSAADAHERLRLMMTMLAQRNGQDLHLSAGAPPSMRLDGELVRLPLPSLTPADLQELVRETLSDDHKRVFTTELELDFAIGVPGVGRFRCNLYRQRGSLAFTARHLKEFVPSGEELRVPPVLYRHALKMQGILMVTGPNGHGKSTTMASLIDAINRARNANIITIEDPIEYHFKHQRSNVNQREVGTDTHSFAEGLRHIVRQNPDVIVVGEMRDYESIATALSAAETGHLVLGTMHALNATAAIDRILDFFPGTMQGQVRGQLSEVLLAIFSQRLVRRADGPGRALAWEMMTTSPRVKMAIRENRIHMLRALMQGNHDDLVPMEQILAEYVGSGLVARDEAARWVDSASYLDDLVRARRDRLRALHAS